jgi:hypothetical protein
LGAEAFEIEKSQDKDESLIVELITHERMVRFIKFEIDYLGIVLEYLPPSSLYDVIPKSKGSMDKLISDDD